MKCFRQSRNEAVTVRKSCGIVSGNSYYRTCVQDSRIPAQITQAPTKQAAVPRSTGVPSRALFIVGAVGVILSGATAFLLQVGPSFEMYFVTSFFYAGTGTVVYTIIGIILGVGLILASMGYLGIRRNYGPGTGTAAFALSIVAAALFFSSAAISLVGSAYGTSYSYYYSSPWYASIRALLILTYVLFGVTQILWGIAHINSRRYTGNSGLTMTTGIILTISGSLTATVIISLAGMMLFSVCSILALIVFLISKTNANQSSPLSS